MPDPFAKRFIVEPGKKVSLAKHDPRDDSAFRDKAAAKEQTAADGAAIDKLQDRLFAEGTRALLIVLQGIDSSGKDGTIRSVFNTCGPIGVSLTPFRAPSQEERDHDFLWRIHKAVPARGMLGIFNRSHYEDVLVVKVRKLASPETVEGRYDEINEFERMLTRNGTRILKFMLNISKDEQAERLRDRVANPDKRWKFNPDDLADRALWDDYMKAYETALARCSTPHAPWHVIPADRNWVRNAAIARITRETLEDMNPQYPEPKDWDPKTVIIT
ncbi:polyphosphate kinase 2 family protein [soil metagenome]